ncbi:MAG TPA: hypothetical protein VNF73_13960 [Candidatus Saccharimonadales bacterium]|nr:hypothetical protein [Candidatus Saccharimonadales bacterium]
MRPAAAASAILAGVLCFVPFVGALAGPDPTTNALQYLVHQQAADGSLDHALGETEDLILGTAAANFDPNTLVACGGRAAFDFLSASVAKAEADAGSTAKLILAVVAGRRDAHAFAGQDLVVHLQSLYNAGSGAYGNGATFGQSLAILALKATSQPIPAAAVQQLASLQDSDGSWNYQTAANSTAGDTNSTAVALEALAAAGVVPSAASVTKALTYLHGQQDADGGFPYQTGSGVSSDPDSDALVIQGLTAVGENPTGTTWTKNGKIVFDDLLSRQAADGGFVFPGNKGPDAFTTSEVPAGLAHAPLPGPVTWTAGAAIPALSCPAAPSASPVSTARPTPHPTARPVPTVGLTLPPTSTIGALQAGDRSPGSLALVEVLAGLTLVLAAVTIARQNARRRN